MHVRVKAFDSSRKLVSAVQVAPRDTFSGEHKGSVEAAEWSNLNEHLFASIGDDGMSLLWDVREASAKLPSSPVWQGT